jgi:hypothetical protein
VTGDRDEVLGRLSEELAQALAVGEAIDAAQWAARFEVEESDVRACQRGLAALFTCLGEEPQLGQPELPSPSLPADFELGEELGRGGMGVVYRARQISLDREVAIKVLRPGDLAFGDALRRFRAEARSLARLRHRHIVSVHDLGETPEGLLWFAMDFVDGSTLADELRSRGRMLPARAVKILRQVTSAIAHAHGQGIVHRDLKPQNVLIDRNGDAFVVDFGLARDAAVAGTRTLTGELLGTPAYMSPEQASGDAGRIGEACDVWALGALMYEMLAGRGPFSGMPLHETIRSILHEDPKPLRKVDKRVPRELELVCMQALRKRPEDRYATALALGEDIERFADGRGVLAQQPSRLVRVARVVRRNWRLAATIAAAVVVTLLAVAVWLPTIRRDAVISEARRLLSSGHPDAAIESFRGVLATTANNAADRETIELDLAQALNDRAGELLAAHDEVRAKELGEQALKLADFRRKTQGAIWAAYWDLNQSWSWEYARAAALTGAQGQEGVGDLSVRLVADLKSALPGRVTLARRVAAKGWTDVSGLDEALKLPILAEAFRANARALVAKQVSVTRAFPYRWLASSLDAWWSPSVEDAIAGLALAAAESPETRAVAFRAFCQLVGLPTYDALRELAGDGRQFPTAKEVADAAPRAIAAWRAWRALPREQALKARIDLLVQAITGSASVFPGAEHHLIAEFVLCTGCPVPSGQELGGEKLREWWEQARQRPFAERLRTSLGLAADAQVSMVEALDRSATASRETARLWRQLAWLQVPDGKRIPEALPEITDGGLVWRKACLEAAAQPDSRALTARIAVLRFDDGGCEPVLVAQQSKLVHIGEQVELELGANIVEPTVLSFRKLWEDELQHVEQPVSPTGPRSIPLRQDRGGISAVVRARVALDQPGACLDANLGLRVLQGALPGRFFRAGAVGCRRVWSGCAAAFDGNEQLWDDGRRLTTFVMLVSLSEGAEDADQGLSWWRSAVARTFAIAAESASRRDSRRNDLDWLTPSLWPMPETLAAMNTLLPDEPRAASPGVRMALMLAGGGPEGLGVWPHTFGIPDAEVGVRLAVGSPNAEVRGKALEALAKLPAEEWTPRLGETMRKFAVDAPGGFSQPLAERLQALPDPDGLWDWFSRANVLLTCAMLILAIWLLTQFLAGSPKWKSISVGWSAGWVLLFLFVRIEVAGIVLLPSFVVLTVALAIAWRASTGRTWHRMIGLGVLSTFTLWAVASWLCGVAPPNGLGQLMLVAVVLAGMPDQRRVPVRTRRRAKPGATGAA